jgi:hypothetical protein
LRRAPEEAFHQLALGARMPTMARGLRAQTPTEIYELHPTSIVSDVNFLLTSGRVHMRRYSRPIPSVGDFSSDPRRSSGPDSRPRDVRSGRGVQRGRSAEIVDCDATAVDAGLKAPASLGTLEVTPPESRSVAMVGRRGSGRSPLDPRT